MFYTRRDNQITLAVRVSPNARRSGIEGLWNGTHLKIALTAPPVDGKANATLIDFLSDFFGLRKSAIDLLSGETGRQKSVHLSFPDKATADTAENKLHTVV